MNKNKVGPEPRFYSVSGFLGLLLGRLVVLPEAEEPVEAGLAFFRRIRVRGG